MKLKLTFLALLSFVLFGCAASVDTANMNADERYAYAKSVYDNEDYQESIKEFEAIIMQYPGNAVVDDAQYYLGMSRYNRKEYILGAYEFSKLINTMANSELISQAQFMIADCYYKLSPDYTLDQKYTRKAIQEFQTFIDVFPQDAKAIEAEGKINEMTEKLAMKDYKAAEIYEKLEYNLAALEYYKNVIDTYHDTKYAPMAMFARINILINKDKTMEAQEEIERFLTRYPNDKRYAEVLKLREKYKGISAK